MKQNLGWLFIICVFPLIFLYFKHFKYLCKNSELINTFVLLYFFVVIWMVIKLNQMKMYLFTLCLNKSMKIIYA